MTARLFNYQSKLKAEEGNLAKLQMELEKTQTESRTEITDLKERLDVAHKQMQGVDQLLRNFQIGEDTREKLVLENLELNESLKL